MDRIDASLMSNNTLDCDKKQNFEINMSNAEPNTTLQSSSFNDFGLSSNECSSNSINYEIKNSSVRIIETSSEPDLTCNLLYTTQSLCEKSTKNESVGHPEVIESPVLLNEELSKLTVQEVNHTEYLCENDGYTSELPSEAENIVHSDASFQSSYELIELETPPKAVLSPQETPIYKTPNIMQHPETSIDEATCFGTPLGPQAAIADTHPLQPLKCSFQRSLFNTNIEKKSVKDKVSPKFTTTKTESKITHSNRTPITQSVFKTPATVNKKTMIVSSEKTPRKLNHYNHIASPIAAYINSPQVPLVKNVRPKQKLTGAVSAIPKLIRETPQTSKHHNKENINLPEVAYISAKETKMIDLQNETRIPQSGSVKKLLSSLPRPLVIKHELRQNTAAVKPKHTPEDSFADLSLHQADVSVCTQKPAMGTAKHKPKK